MNFFGADSMTSDPFRVVQDWIGFAKTSGDIEVDAAHLATVDADGLPNVRVVYIREFEAEGFVFYTNYRSQKGIELAHGKAAMNIFHAQVKRQIRIRGEIEKVSEAQSDQYFLGRHKGSRLGAWVSQQSQPLASREQMLNEWGAMDEAKADQRPPHWGGYRLRPLEIEFMAMGEFRLHDRFRWTRGSVDDESWKLQRLYP